MTDYEKPQTWAKEHVNGNKWNVWVVVLIVAIISSVLERVVYSICGISIADTTELSSYTSYASDSTKNIVDFVIDLVKAPLNVGVCVYMVNLIKGQSFELEQLFNKYTQFVRIFITTLLRKIITTLFYFLLIIPGIIKEMQYFLVNYILADPDYENLNSKEILDLSKQIMEGHKMECFKLQIVYILWIFIGIFTLGILWIWKIPEMYLALGKYATDLIDDYKKNNKVSAKEVAEPAEA